MQTSRDARQVIEPDADVARLFLENRTARILGQRPPGIRLADWYECRARRLRPRQTFLFRTQALNLGTRRVARIAGRTAQSPHTVRRGIEGSTFAHR